MLDGFNPKRYSVIEEKNKREIVMLIGTGCKWARCNFCDYHLDFDQSEEVCYNLNKFVLGKVTGIYQKLEVINSGSFTELDDKTIDLIEKIAIEKNLKEIHFECHYLYREKIPDFRDRFAKNSINLKIKCGVETFDSKFREKVLNKGMGEATPKDIAQFFDEVCLLQGLEGQTQDSMTKDIKIGLKYFDRVCINIMQENECPIKPKKSVIKIFAENIYPFIKDNERIDILLENTAFGVGGVTSGAESGAK